MPASPDPLDAVTAAPGHHTLLLENDSVRILETRIEPGHTVPLPPLGRGVLHPVLEPFRAPR